MDASHTKEKVVELLRALAPQFERQLSDVTFNLPGAGQDGELKFKCDAESDDRKVTFSRMELEFPDWNVIENRLSIELRRRHFRMNDELAKYCAFAYSIGDEVRDISSGRVGVVRGGVCEIDGKPQVGGSYRCFYFIETGAGISKVEQAKLERNTQ